MTTSLIAPDGSEEILNVSGEFVSITAHSIDGSIVAGNRVLPGSSAFRGWFRGPGGEVVDIGTLTGGSSATDAALIRESTQDGRTLVGTSRNSDGQFQAFTWSEGEGIAPLDFRPNAVGSTAFGISADGDFITGTSTVVCTECVPEQGDDAPPGTIASYFEAFTWNAESGRVALGTLLEPPDPIIIDGVLRPFVPQSTQALAISADGSTVVGRTSGYGSFEGFVWREDTGMLPLPKLPNQPIQFFPNDISGDGSVVVGRMGGSCGTNCFMGPGAVIWDEENGTRLIKDVLVDEFGLGDVIGDVFLEEATFISSDSRTIAGKVDQTIGGGTWLVTLPTINGNGDLNGDGVVNAADFTVWRDSLGTSGLTPFTLGDADGDGSVTASDYDVWVDQFGELTDAESSLAIPEPTSVCLLLSVLITRRSRSAARYES